MGKSKSPKSKSPPKGSRSKKIPKQSPPPSTPIADVDSKTLPSATKSVGSPENSVASQGPRAPDICEGAQLEGKNVPMIASEADSDTTDMNEATTNLVAAVDRHDSHVIAITTADPVQSKEEVVVCKTDTTTGRNNTVPQEKPAQTQVAGKSTDTPGQKQDTYCSHVKGNTKKLKKTGEAFTLPSGEVCVKIPNSVIEKNKKSWDCFVLGQFYSNPPS